FLSSLYFTVPVTPGGGVTCFKPSLCCVVLKSWNYSGCCARTTVHGSLFTAQAFSTCKPFNLQTLLRHFLRVCHSHKFVRAAIVEEKLTAQPHHALDKYYVRNLPNLLPFFFRPEDGLIGSRDHFPRIGSVEDRNTRAI